MHSTIICVRRRTVLFSLVLVYWVKFLYNVELCSHNTREWLYKIQLPVWTLSSHLALHSFFFISGHLPHDSFNELWWSCFNMRPLTSLGKYVMDTSAHRNRHDSWFICCRYFFTIYLKKCSVYKIVESRMRKWLINSVLGRKQPYPL
jgi:hypothetical protein